MTIPTGYRLTIETKVGTGELLTTLQLFDDDNGLVGPLKVVRGTSFCMTWQDIVASVEQYFTEAGGTLNVALNRPSPFVDLT